VQPQEADREEAKARPDSGVRGDLRRAVGVPDQESGNGAEQAPAQCEAHHRGAPKEHGREPDARGGPDHEDRH
jgi:hypothetical protein